MTIFGDGKSINGTITHNGTMLDATFNYIFGAVLAGAIPISFLLNPLMFYYNYKMFKQQHSIVPALFQLLSVLDFLFTTRSINTAYNLMKPDQDPLFDPSPTTYQRLQSFFAYIEAYTSMFVTMVLCVVRYAKIRAPLWALGNRSTLTGIVVVAIFVDLTWTISVSVMGSFIRGTIWFSPLQGIMITVDDSKVKKQLCDQYYANIVAPFYIKVGLSLLFSILTVIHLRSAMGKSLPEIKRRSIIMIVLLNTGNMFWFVLCVASNIITERNHYAFGLNVDTDWSYWYFYISFSSAIMAPALLAAYNPLLFCSRTTGIRTMIRHFFLTGRLEVLEEGTNYTRSPCRSNMSSSGRHPSTEGLLSGRNPSTEGLLSGKIQSADGDHSTEGLLSAKIQNADGDHSTAGLSSDKY